eukprot:4337266-Amphidinium_carterae.1
MSSGTRVKVPFSCSMLLPGRSSPFKSMRWERRQWFRECCVSCACDIVMGVQFGQSFGKIGQRAGS